MSKFLNTPVPRGTAGWVVMDEAMDYVVRALTANPYLLGPAFSAADVLYASTFALFGTSPLLPKSPAIDAYVKRCVERPAFARASAKDNG
jgi:glutathione S-transferase